MPLWLTRNRHHFTAQSDPHVKRGVVVKPRIAVALPVIRAFNLRALFEALPEQTVLIVQTVARSGLTHIRHGIQETGCQTTQAAITQRRIRFGFQHVSE